jgi:hypothetical protein
MKCPKCNREMDYSISIVGGRCYDICPSCIEKLPTIARENWVMKNIYEAKEKRDRGDSPWDKKNRTSI